MDPMRYKPLGLTVEDVDNELDQLWVELNKPGSLLAEKALSDGIDVSQIKGQRRADFITVHSEGAGLDPATTAIVVAFAPVVAKILRDLWDRILLPRILRAYGGDSLTPTTK